MTRRVLGFSLIAWLAALGSAADDPSLVAFLSPPPIREPILSPDGQRVAYISHDKGKSLIVCLDLKTGMAEGVARGIEVHTLVWKGNNTLVFDDPRVADLGIAIVTLAPRGIKNHPLAADGPIPAVRIAGALSEDPKNILVRKQNSSFKWVYVKANIETGLTKTVLDDHQTAYSAGFITDGTGRLRALTAVTNDGYELRIFNDSKPNAGIKIKKWGPNELGWRLIGRSRDSKTVFVLSHESHDLGCVYGIDFETLQHGEPLVAPTEAPLRGFITPHRGTELLGVESWGGAAPHWFDPVLAKIQPSLDAAFPKGHARVVSSSADQLVHIVELRSAHEPVAWYILNQRNKALTLMAKHDVPSADIAAPTIAISIPARDGVVLNGYLTKPLTGKNLPGDPLILRPWPTPFAGRFEGWFDAETFFWVKQGYAVLRLNYRGTAGYGVAYERAGYGQVAEKIIDDIHDAARWAVQQKLTSQGKICLWGDGWAGGLVLSCAAEDPDLYACVVNHRGFTDWNSAFSGSSEHLRADRIKFFGAVKDEPVRAPRNAVKKLRVPLFNIYDVEDLGHSHALEAILKDAKVPFEKSTYTLLKDEDFVTHLIRQKNYLQVVPFVSKHLKGP